MKSIKKLLGMVLVVSMLVSLVGCADADSGSAKESNGGATTMAEKTTEKSMEKMTWKFSTLGSDDLAQTQGVFAFEVALEELSGGTIDVETYINGTLYNQDAATEAIIAGDLELNLSTFGFVGDYYAPATMFSSAYNFKNYDHLQAFITSDLFDTFATQVEENTEFHIVSLWYNGSRTLNPGWAEPVMTPEDLKGKLLRTPNNPGMIAMGESLGATVSPIAFGELYTALQAGTVDAEENPLPQIQASKFHEITKQISLTNHQIEALPLVMPKSLWSTLTDEQKGWVEEAAEAGRKKTDNMNLDNEAKLVDWFKAEGMVVVEPDLEAFQAYSANYYKENGLMSDWDMDLYNALQELQ